ncbi:MAG: family 20 glycosylhydrolase [Gemmatimonadales bacterium]
MPAPESLSVQAGRLALDSTFTFASTGYTDPRLVRAMSRAMRRLEGRTSLILPRGPVAAESAGVAQLVVRVTGPGGAVQGVDEDESYALTVGARQVQLEAPTVVGALRGLETFLQLAQGDASGWYLPLATIHDRPRFTWRGLLIDVSRHWEPPAVIERSLDAMAAVKLNVLHLHLSDDQGFRVESKRYPRLQEMGSDGQYYTQDQIREIVAYARDRGIRVVPEFDMPGHVTSWFVGYPEYASAPGPYALLRAFGVHDAVFDPTREEVYRFIDGFIGEMAALFPDAYWHVGGDENNGRQWSANPRVQAFMQRRGLKDNAALQAYFNQRLLQILAKHGKRMVGWDEILHPDLPKSIVIQSWRGVASLADAARQGYSSILSSGYYLDGMATAADYYRVDPLPDSLGLTPDQARLVLGGEACMWGEVITPETIDSRIWPRTAAIAERFWSPKSVTDPDDMYRRLAVMNDELEELGVSTASHTARMLSRLVPGLDRRRLEVLLGVASPTSLGMHRFASQTLMQYIPLTSLSDAAVPDPAGGREVASEIKALLADAPRYGAYRGELARTFGDWRDAGQAIAAQAQRSPMVNDVLPVAMDLAGLGQAGLEALAYLEAGTAAPQSWVADRTALIARATQPKDNLRLTIVPALRDLVAAAGASRQ